MGEAISKAAEARKDVVIAARCDLGDAIEEAIDGCDVASISVMPARPNGIAPPA